MSGNLFNVNSYTASSGRSYVVGELCETLKLLGHMSSVCIFLKLREGWKISDPDTELIGICLPVEGF